jgi:methylamine utilization protein MauJ
MSITLPSMKDLMTGELAVSGNWVVANLDTQIPWPTKLVKVTFRNRSLFLLPPTSAPLPTGSPFPSHETYPCVAIRLNAGEQFDNGMLVIFHFLSSLAWVERLGVRVEYWSGGNLPRPMGGRPRHPTYREEFYRPYLPDPTEQPTRWALAFYREGLSLNHVAYQCLSFFKILNIFLPTGSKQKDWMNAHIADVSGGEATKRISAIQTQHGDVGDYLYSSGRCAIAHAGEAPTADPENPSDIRRLGEDLPLVRALAEVAIEKEFGIKSASTVYREHLYELEGFRKVFREPRVDRIKTLASIGPSDWPVLPRMSFRLVFHDPYPPLERMNARILKIDQGIAVIKCTSEDGLTHLTLKLNFVQERLQADMLTDLESNDDGSAATARSAAKVCQFQLDYFKNGILEVWDADTAFLLGRRDAFLPVNVDMTGTIANFETSIRETEDVANERALAQSAKGSGE